MDIKSHSPGSVRAYLHGLVLCLILTLAAYFFVTEHVFEGWLLFYAIFVLAGLQAVVQLILFLHVGKEQKPHWNLSMFLFVVLIIAIIVTGTLWIMESLNTRTMTPMKASEQIPGAE